MFKFKRKRVKVSSKICRELQLYPWDRSKISKILWEEFKMELTSRRNFIYYFHPHDELKLSVFFLKYGEFVIS